MSYKRKTDRHYDPRGPRNQTDSERFWRKVRGGDVDECWTWTACRNDHGYGKFWNGIKYERAHRVAWTELRGEIPAGLVVDHLCHVRACVNPWHMQLTSLSVNSARTSESMKLACVQGHPYDEVNTARRPNGDRYCKTCNRERVRQNAARSRQRPVESP